MQDEVRIISDCSFNVGACCCIYHAFFDIDSNLGGVFSCLSVLLKLNHKIVEPLLTDIWLLIFTLCQGSEKVRATSFCQELVFHVVVLSPLLSMKMEVVDFANDCIGIYSKLRQV